MKKCLRIIGLAILFSILSGTSLMAAQSTYTVKAGDSLWTISNSTGISVDKLKQLNHLGSDSLQIGQQLLLQSSSPNVSTPAKNPPTAANSSAYYVQPGDSLWKISTKYGMSVARLMQINNLTSDKLNVGQCLLVDAQPAPTPSRSGSPIDGLRIIEKAQEFLGTPYRYGGTGPGGFDCSGFVRYIFAQFGFDLPHNAAAQLKNGASVEKSDLSAGDLVFFACSGSGIDHVGIYSGNNQFIHSSSPRSGGVIYSSLANGYYAGTYAGARRIIR
ncbi:MAG: LysM peptidoglycan-binding domain-containing protein [Syntrophomonas sp.]